MAIFRQRLFGCEVIWIPEKGLFGLWSMSVLVRMKTQSFSHTFVPLEQHLKVKQIKSIDVACHVSLGLSVVQSET